MNGIEEYMEVESYIKAVKYLDIHSAGWDSRAEGNLIVVCNSKKIVIGRGMTVGAATIDAANNVMKTE